MRQAGRELVGREPEVAVASEVLDRLGSDRMLMFATDYPHHQFDDPTQAAPAGLSADARFLGGNALATYRLE